MVPKTPKSIYLSTQDFLTPLPSAGAMKKAVCPSPKFTSLSPVPLPLPLPSQDIDGKEFSEEFVGWDARVVMHENDHLNGVLMINRIPTEERKLLDPRLRKINQQHNPKK